MNTDWIGEAREAGERRALKALLVFFLVVPLVVLIPTFTIEHFFGFRAGVATMLVILLLLFAVAWFRPNRRRER